MQQALQNKKILSKMNSDKISLSKKPLLKNLQSKNPFRLKPLNKERLVLERSLPFPEPRKAWPASTATVPWSRPWAYGQAPSWFLPLAWRRN